MKMTLLFLLSISSGLGASEFPRLYNSERGKSAPMPPAEAAASLRLPPGFRATVFAAEPEVQNPIAMAWDARGRLWVAENYTYAESGKKFDLSLRDRILIFEDKDGDGHFDTRKVFSDDLQMLTSLEIGHGGVWVMCPPQLRFIPDRNRDDVPDGVAEVMLDGLTGSPDMHHTFANGLRFGPDGWLYGRCGASSTGEVGRPGTPPEKRIPLRGTIWRFHPQHQTVEVLSSGTTNPWGHDWNEHGELFFINTVNGHLWHGIAGAHFERPHTLDPNPRVYALIDQHADHWHFDTSNGWQKSRDGSANALGGGHAHVGMMIYQGDNWPAEYRGRLFTLNLHGRRANQEILARQGSGYVGRHGPDFFVSGDPWFRGMEISYGPDGGVFVLDWSDTGECHEYSGVHRTSGRIFKITYPGERAGTAGLPGPGGRPPFDLAKLEMAQLAALQAHANEWFARQARLEMAARDRGQRDLDAARPLRVLFEKHADLVVRLRALWSLQAIGAIDEAFLRAQLNHRDEHVRTWAIRFLTERWPLDTMLSQRPATDSASPEATSDLEAQFVRLAKKDRSGLVRLALASTLQRLPVAERLELAAALMTRAEDANDHNLPLLTWYGLIPVADHNLAGLGSLAAKCEWSLVRNFVARRLAEEIEANPGPLNDLIKLAATRPMAFQADVLNGMADGLNGWHKATRPGAWTLLAKKAEQSPALRERVRDLSVLFGDGRALDTVRAVALDRGAALKSRKVALQTLIDNRAPGLRELCEQVLGEQFLNAVAIRGLAQYNDAAVGSKLVKAYRQFHFSERGQVLSVLVSRPAFARVLLDAVAEGKIARAEITAFHARQIRSLAEPGLSDRLAAVWGQFSELSADKKERLARWKSQLTPAILAQADKRQGRAVFNQTCASCHVLYGEGGKAGPDLTGGGRHDLDYLLENLVDPSAVVTADFRMSIVELRDGRVLNGLLTAKTDRTVTIQTMTELITIERAEIADLRDSKLSLMPEGMLEALTAEQAQNLIAYLMQSGQVVLPEGAEPNRNKATAR